MSTEYDLQMIARIRQSDLAVSVITEVYDAMIIDGDQQQDPSIWSRVAHLHPVLEQLAESSRCDAFAAAPGTSAILPFKNIPRMIYSFGIDRRVWIFFSSHFDSPADVTLFVKALTTYSDLFIVQSESDAEFGYTDYRYDGGATIALRECSVRERYRDPGEKVYWKDERNLHAAKDIP